jgi:hypothetical protein
VTAPAERVLRVRRSSGAFWELQVDAQDLAVCPTCSERLHVHVVLDHLGVWARMGLVELPVAAQEALDRRRPVSAVRAWSW